MIHEFKIFSLLSLFLTVILSLCSCKEDATEKKPVRDIILTNPIIRESRPDPTVWYDGGVYYTVSTGLGSIYRSYDMVSWEKSGITVISNTDKEKMKGYASNFWAPDVAYVGGKWHMYMTLYNSAQDSGIGVLVQDEKSKTFIFQSRITWSRETGIKDSIDPEVLQDPSTGKTWLFFGSVGGIHRVELDASGEKLKAGAQYTHVAGLDIDKDKSRSRVYEGCYLHRHGDWWYLFASAGRYDDSSYRIVVGRSASLEGEFKDREGRKMTEGYATEVLSSEASDRFYGPGHNGEIFTDSTGQDYIYYHCHDKTMTTAGNRAVFLQRIYWDAEGWPYMETGKPLKEETAPKL